MLDTKEIAPKCVVEAVSGAKEKGQSLYDKYVEERLIKRCKPVTDTVQRCILPLFGTPEKRPSSKTSSLVTDLKSDCRLFSRLYIACQAREGNLEEFFASTKTVQVHLHFLVMTRCVQDRNQSLSHALKSTQR